jgi:hypothetical protein
VNVYERMKGFGISDDRLRAMGVAPPARKPVADVIAAPDAAAAVADLALWREYRDTADAFARMRLRAANNEAIERGRALDFELPETKDQ